MAKSRLIGSYPVIGIRPTIDGRRGALDVRGSLEDQTMNMAKSAAKLFEENLRYSNGEPVKVVIADTTIGRVGESAACADKFRKEGVDITLTVTPCWCYGAETMDMDPQTIKAVWGFNGTERPGAVYLASVLATHAQKGLPAFGIYGHDVQEADDTSIPEDVKEKLLRFGRAAVAAASMRGKSYLQIGSVTMGIGGSIIDSDFIESYLGMRVESVDEVEIIRRMTEGIYDHAEFEKALKWAKETCKIGCLLDHNLISGARNILLNISVANAEELMYEEVVRILEYIQAHASVEDESGNIHNANIIWGTSEKPQLGNAIELVVVATGFEGDEEKRMMETVIPPARIVKPVPEGADPAGKPVLEPVGKPGKATPQTRPLEQVILGEKSTRYSNIDQILAKPAYQSRKAQFIVEMPAGRKEVLKEEKGAAERAEENRSESLFD